MFTIASNFSFIGRFPVQVTFKPRYFILVCPKYDFLILYLSPFALRFFSTSSNLSKLSDQSPLVITNRSSMYALINSILQNISFIFSWRMSWKMSGELPPPPSGKHLYLHFTHGRIIVHKLLDYSLIYI